MDEIWFDECVSADEPKSIPKWKIGRICKDVKQDKKSKSKEDYRKFIKNKMKKRSVK